LIDVQQIARARQSAQLRSGDEPFGQQQP
jgi:hypothetical protein